MDNNSLANALMIAGAPQAVFYMGSIYRTHIKYGTPEKHDPL